MPALTSLVRSDALANTPASALVSRCVNSSFSALDVAGAQILSVDAQPVLNHTSVVTEDASIIHPGTWDNLNVCNVTVTYNHPGRDNAITVSSWLPLEGWNGRFLATGGGGYVAGYPPPYHAPVVQHGYATASTDAGHSRYNASAANWALDSSGLVDTVKLEDFAYIALADLAPIGQQITELFYGQPANYSYFAGCSTGGRQGLMMAQKYPDAFDGIMAAAPAVNWTNFVLGEFWPQQVMNRLGYYPAVEELEAITAAATAACDENDGVKDNIISNAENCEFDALTLVNETYTDSNGATQRITKEAATIANAVWHGPEFSNGTTAWYGLNYDTPLAELAGSKCTNSSRNSCFGVPFTISSEWMRYFLFKDGNFDLASLSTESYLSLFERNREEYGPIIGTAVADLTPFRNSGGKLISWHGLADPVLFPNGTTSYYQNVLAVDPNAADFYRYFQAPGVSHCSGGVGPAPDTFDTLDSLVSWVEDDVAPETLVAKKEYGDERGDVERHVCAWPKQQKYVGGDENVASSFECV